MTTVEEWRAFLQQWSDDWLQTDHVLPTKMRERRWFGVEPATESQIAETERRLGYRLPPSYRAFLLTTNGWLKVDSLMERIRPVEEVQWLEDDDPQMCEIWMGEGEPEPLDGLTREEYFSYDGRPFFFDRVHFRKPLKIADSAAGDSAIYVLNPLAVVGDGEWEAWMHAHWIPGAERFPSFSHLMKSSYATFCTIEFGAKSEPVVGPFAGVYAPDRKRTRAKRVGRGVPRRRRLTVEELVEQLGSAAVAERQKAANALYREFKPRSWVDEKPALVESLARILFSDLEADVRVAAAYMLGTYGDDRAIELLVKALRDPDSGVSGSAVSSLHYISVETTDPRIADGLCVYLQSPRDPTTVGMALTILSDFEDPRAGTIGLRLLDEVPSWPLLPFEGAFAVAKHLENGAAELVKRLGHENPTIRAAAAAGLRQLRNPDAGVMQPLRVALTDVDAQVRQQAATSLRMLGENVPLTPEEEEERNRIAALVRASKRSSGDSDSATDDDASMS